MGPGPHIRRTGFFPTLDVLAVAETGLIKSALVVSKGVARAQKMAAWAHLLVGITGEGLIGGIQALIQQFLVTPQPIGIHHQFFESGT